jgi:hypothetical protein
VWPNRVGGHGELQRQEERLGQRVIDLVALLEDAVDDGGVGDPIEEVLDHDVLVVLAQQPPCLGEGAALVDQPVVGLEEGQVQLGDDQVLVVAGVTDPGGAVVGEVRAGWFSRQVVVVALALGPQRRLLGPLQGGNPPEQQLVEVGEGPGGRGAVQAVQLKSGGAQVLEVVADGGKGQGRQVGGQQLGGGEGAGFQGDVVVDELAEVGVDGRQGAVAGGRAGIDHRPAKLFEPAWGGRVLGQQVGRVVLQGKDQEVKVLQGGGAGHREAEVDLGGAAGQVALGVADLLGGGNRSMGQTRHGHCPPWLTDAAVLLLTDRDHPPYPPFRRGQEPNG